MKEDNKRVANIINENYIR